MSGRESVWSFGLLALLVAAMTMIRRFRSPTIDFQHSAMVKARLPLWVKLFELLTLSAFAVASMIGVMLLISRLSPELLPGTHAVAGVSAVYFGVGTALIGIPFGALWANVVSWLTPPVRVANLAAMDGLSVSFWSANRGLLLFAAMSLPLGLLVMFIAKLSPWRT